jgi:hypothetical protein
VQQTIKTIYYKFPTKLEMCSFGNDGFYLFTQTTLGRDYLMVGDNPREIQEWIANRAATQGFWNGVYKTMADKLGHDVFWEAGHQGQAQNRAFKMPTVAQSRAFQNQTTWVCPYCGQARTARDVYHQEGGVKYCSPQHYLGVKRRQLGAKMGGIFRPKGNATSTLLTGSTHADDINAYLDDEEAGPFLPAGGSDGAADVPNNIYLRPYIMKVSSKDQAIQGLNPLADVVKELGMAASSFAPGGNASAAGSAAQEYIGIITDIYQEFLHEKVKGGLKSAGVIGTKPNLRPVVCVSYHQSDKDESFNFGSGENNSGKVTFAAIERHQNYKKVMDKLDGLWGAAQGAARSA